MLNRQRFEEGMAEELRFHIEQYTADLVRSGVSPSEAARRARLEFGSLDGIKDDCRQSRGLRLFDELLRNARYASRLLLKAPGFTAAAVLPFALCLGANLAIFALIDSVLLRPLPFPDPERLVTLYKSYPKVNIDRDGASAANYYERRGKIGAFSGLAIFRHGTSIVGATGTTEREEISEVSSDFFSTLGLGPAMGRAFTDAEMTYNTDRVAILTDSAWRRRFQADPKVLGRQIRLDGVERTVVGVLPPEFRFLSSAARIYVPFASSMEDRRAPRRHSANGAELIARLNRGATLDEAQSQIDALDAGIAHEYPQARMIADAGYRTKVASLHADHVASIRPTLLLMQAGVFFLLLIGAVNLVNLLLIRAGAHVKELAVRLAMGASRGHVVGEVMVETTLLTSLGGLVGLGVGAGGIQLLATLGAERLPLGARIAFDARLALVALITSIAIGIVVGLPIAWLNLQKHLGQALGSETRGGTSGRAEQRLRHGFIVAQISLAFVLLAGAGLLGLSLEKAASASLGFPADHLLSGQVTLPYSSYFNVGQRLAFTQKLMEEVANTPGVLAAGIVTNVPLSGHNTKSAIAVKSHPIAPGTLPRVPYAVSVDGHYFSAMRLPLREGRFLTAADSRRKERTCVVDESFAHHYWPKGGALGQVVSLGSKPQSDAEGHTIVGVVGTAKQADVTEGRSEGAVYFPWAYRNERQIWIVARTSGAPESLGAALQQIVRKIDPELPVSDIRSMEMRISDSLVARRAPALLAGIFAGVALLLAAMGTYGVLSYAVAQRRREIGVRMALGARPGQIHWQFFELGLRLLAGGTAVGALGAWMAGRAMQTLLFDVPSLHLPTLARAAGVIGLATFVACLLPSHRAAGISPVEALSDQ